MPGCTIEREVIGSTATYRISGFFESACAWDLGQRIEKEPLGELTLDFSRVGDYVDYGVAVVANALLALENKRIHLQGLRQHQLRLFKYFGVCPEELAQRGEAPSHEIPKARAAAVSEVA